MFLFTLPAIFAAFVNRFRLVGKLILIAFFIVCMLNILLALSGGLSITKWFRLAFGSYIFVGVIFLVGYKADTAERRHLLWVILICLLMVATLFDWAALIRHGFATTFEKRMMGRRPWALVAAMLLMPAWGNVLRKYKYLLVSFWTNMIVCIMSASRIVYLILFTAMSYTIFIVHKSLAKRIGYIITAILLGGIILATPIYTRMEKRFSTAFGQDADSSVLGRLDEAESAVDAARATWKSLIIGKGFGIPWIRRYPRTGIVSKAGYTVDMPHNDYAARLLYCGLVGLFLQLLMYFAIAYYLFKAIRRARKDNADIFTQIRLHGSLLVLMDMAAFGFTGGVFYYWSNNVFEACAIGIGLADATAILSVSKMDQNDPRILIT